MAPGSAGFGPSVSAGPLLSHGIGAEPSSATISAPARGSGRCNNVGSRGEDERLLASFEKATARPTARSTGPRKSTLAERRVLRPRDSGDVSGAGQAGLYNRPNVVYRLERKKALRCVKRISNANIFEAVISRKDAQRRFVDELLAVFGGRAKLVMATWWNQGNSPWRT